MVSLFSSRKRRTDSYQGFRKYGNDLSGYNLSEINNNNMRSQSLTSGAGEAAVAALRMHQERNAPAANRNSYSNGGFARANSLSGVGRSNSLRTYVYNPKPSYVAGQPIGQTGRRYNSLSMQRSGSLGGNAPLRTGSLSSQGAYVPKTTPVYEQDEEDEDVTITTKTTKVVDASGRTLSITVEVTKLMPDGTTVTSTTTKNISRSNSRTNSLNAQSLTGRGGPISNPVRNNSMLSNNAGYNLSKIEEDLHDFDYSYETEKYRGLDEGALNGHSLENDAHRLKLNHEAPVTSSKNNEFKVPDAVTPKSQFTTPPSQTNMSPPRSTDSNKPLRSILKKKSARHSSDEDDLSSREAATDSGPIPEAAPVSHPYATLGSKRVMESPKMGQPNHFPPGGVRHTRRPLSDNRLDPSPEIVSSKVKSPKMSSPLVNHDDGHSNNSVSSAPVSIKFDEKVETIPIYDPSTTQKQKEYNVELYSKALEVAKQRVLGNKENSEAENDVKALANTKTKQDMKLGKLDQQGVSENYRYENHHKDFVGLSLREDKIQKSPNRKSRAKEEKKQFKDALKEQKKKEKTKQKIDADAEKISKKESAKSQKGHKPKKFASLFTKKKHDTPESVHSIKYPQDISQDASVEAKKVSSEDSEKLKEEGVALRVNTIAEQNKGAQIESNDADFTRTPDLNNKTNIITLTNNSTAPVNASLESHNLAVDTAKKQIDGPHDDFSTSQKHTLDPGLAQVEPKKIVEGDDGYDKVIDEYSASKDTFEVPGTIQGVDSSIINAIDAGDQNKFTAADETKNLGRIVEDGSSTTQAPLDSQVGSEKRKGKVLESIRVPVLNEVRSETTSIESPSKYVMPEESYESEEVEEVFMDPEASVAVAESLNGSSNDDQTVIVSQPDDNPREATQKLPTPLKDLLETKNIKNETSRNDASLTEEGVNLQSREGSRNAVPGGINGAKEYVYTSAHQFDDLAPEKKAPAELNHSVEKSDRTTFEDVLKEDRIAEDWTNLLDPEVEAHKKTGLSAAKDSIDDPEIQGENVSQASAIPTTETFNSSANEEELESKGKKGKPKGKFKAKIFKYFVNSYHN